MESQSTVLAKMQRGNKAGLHFLALKHISIEPFFR